MVQSWAQTTLWNDNLQETTDCSHPAKVTNEGIGIKRVTSKLTSVNEGMALKKRKEIKK